MNNDSFFKFIAMNSFVSILVLTVMLKIMHCETTTNEIDHTFELMQSLNLARQEHIQRVCDHLNATQPLLDIKQSSLEHILIDHKHKLLYCYVPKIACTNWKRIMMILGDKWNNTNVLGIPANLAHSPGMFANLANMTDEEKENVVENYTKLILVRHPFERLLSAYHNKLEDKSQSAQYFQQRVGKLIIRRFRVNASNSSLALGNDVTFKEFVEFLTSPAVSTDDVPYTFNEHWASITNLCHPCTIKYNLIGKYETLLDDSILALHTINASYIQFPRDTRTSGTASKLKKYYLPLPLDLMMSLFNIYKTDFELFNYSLEEILGFDLG